MREMEGSVYSDDDDWWDRICQWSLPLNPEIGWETKRASQAPQQVSSWTPSPPIIPQNPYASMLLDDQDDFAPMPLSFLLAPDPKLEFSEATQQGLPAICTSTDVMALQKFVFATVTEKLGGKCGKMEYLRIWKATCGGDYFMALGMMTYWKDPVKSPQRLKDKRQGYQRKFSKEEDKHFRPLLEEELEQEIVEKISPDQAAYTSPVGIVPKKGGEWRKIWDGRVVNEEQMDIHFRMEGVETVQMLMRKGDWATSIDLKSAFNHLQVSMQMRPFLAFQYEGQHYRYKAMPFGSKHSPRLFTEALSYPMRYIRAHWDIRIVQYMDDLLLLHQDPRKLQLYTLQIAAYLQSLGWTLSLKKCALTPAQTVVYLGWLWDCRTLTMTMTAEMRSAILEQLKNWLGWAEKSAIVTSKSLGALIGSLNFLRGQFPRASLYLRTLHSALTEMVNSVGWTGSSALTPRVSSELLFWSRSVRFNAPYCFEPRVSQAMLTTDASEAEWGAHIEIGYRVWLSNGSFCRTDSLSSSNQRETAAVLRALTYFQPLLQQEQIRALTVRSDNTVTVYNLQRQGAGIALLDLTRAIFSLLQQLDIRIHVCHIPGVENVLADHLSRMEATGDYSLKQELFVQGCKMLQTMPTIDLFAHARNAKCTRFVSLSGSLQTGSLYQDAFSRSWKDEIPYLFPPVQIVDRVLQRVREENLKAIIVVPKWTSKPWWGTFRPMAKMVVELGRSDLILPPGPSMTSSKSKKELPPGHFLMALLTPPY